MDKNGCYNIGVIGNGYDWKGLEAESSNSRIKKAVEKYQNGDPDAAEELYLEYLPSIKRFVKTYENIPGSILEREDLMQEAASALFQAAARYNPERGTEFSTYAQFYMFDAVTNAIEKSGFSIRIPSYKRDRILKASKMNTQFSDEHDNKKRMELISESSKMSVEEVEDCLNLSDKMTNVVSLDSFRNKEDVDDLGSLIGYDDEDPVETEVSYRDMKEKLYQALDTLSPREKMIIEMQYGLDGKAPKTQGEIGKVFGISGARVNQIVKTALEKLRRPSTIKGLKGYED